MRGTKTEKEMDRNPTTALAKGEQHQPDGERANTTKRSPTGRNTWVQVPSGLDEPGPVCPGAPKMAAENSLAQWGGAGVEVWMKAEGEQERRKRRRGEKRKETVAGGGMERKEAEKEIGTHTRRRRERAQSGPAGRGQQVDDPNTWVSRHPAACVGGDPGLGRWAAVAVSTTMMESTQKKRQRKRGSEEKG